MSPDQAREVKVVAADLRYLKKRWGGSVDTDELRRNSVVLRRLLIEDGYGRAWRALGFPGQPQIAATDLVAHRGKLNPDQIIFAEAGGAKRGTMQVQGITMVNYAMSPEEIAERFKQGPQSKVYTLPEFLSSECFSLQGKAINRRQVIKYVANKLGGAHFDTKRDPNQKDAEIIAFLDEILASARTSDMEAVYYELLSIGQAVARSKDTQKFLLKSLRTPQ